MEAKVAVPAALLLEVRVLFVSVGLYSAVPAFEPAAEAETAGRAWT